MRPFRFLSALALASAICLLSVLPEAGAAPRKPVRSEHHVHAHARFVRFFDRALFTTDTRFLLSGVGGAYNSTAYGDIPEDAVPVLVRFSDDGTHIVEIRYRRK